jgi:hypothetical protein
VACARGEFTRAIALAEPLARRAADRSVRVSASLTLASALRQTDRHRLARPHDERALRLATDKAERAHALIGLAADAVGVGDRPACERRLRQAAEAAPRGDWRVWVRLYWVRAEHALLADDPRHAARWAALALARAKRAGAARHVAKSLLFLGVALDAAGDARARRPLTEAARAAARLGAEPIAAVAHDVLARSAGGSRAAGTARR